MNANRNFYRLEALWKAILTKPSLAPVRSLLRVVSWGYGAAISVRNALYDRGVLKTTRLAVPVVSVGNLVLGGTGKTPFVERLALSLNGSVAVLSRGYGGSAERERRPVIVSMGLGAQVGPAVCGDEPFLLAENLPGVKVIVGRDRVASAHLAMALGASVILLDDGLQHRRLHRDVEIVLLTEKAEELFPRGKLRESMRALKRADFIFHPQHLHMKPQAVVGDLRLEPNGLRGRRIGVFCGLGNPQKFIRTVQSLGAVIVDQWLFSDHANLSPSELRKFALRSQKKGASLLVCTQKDWVKLSRSESLCLPVSYLQARMEITDTENWIALCTQIKKFRLDARSCCP